MKKSKRILVLWAILAMTFVISNKTFAAATAAAMDYSQKGSITVDILSTETENPIPGGTMTLYQVATAGEEQGTYTLELTDAFRDSQVNLMTLKESDTGAKELAAKLAAYADTKRLQGQAAAVDEKGQAKWQDLALGVYLIRNTTPADGYAPVSTFLITIPRYLNGAYVYDVQANPKAGTASKAIPKPTVSPSKPALTGSRLPQTGQLWWPVPILALGGIFLVSLGWIRRRD